MPAVTVFIIIFLTVWLQGQLHLILRPDLVLILTVILSVKLKKEKAVTWAFLSGWSMDALFSFGFINTFSKTAAAMLAVFLKRFFIWPEMQLATFLVLILTPVSKLIEMLLLKVFYTQNVPLWPILGAAVINLILTPFVFYLLDHLIKSENE
ncbi:rod shape-determining protein MreD [Candidatus Saganbacteria bacterium]|nr:rod shape-determining protein MreD [Candidatus Saganbacteria bacterium]